MAYQINMNTFWSDLGVACGNTNGYDWYSTWEGILMGDGTIIENATQFFNYLGLDRESFFNQWEIVSGGLIYDETSFYQNTTDPKIHDFDTFYKFAPSYFPKHCTPTIPYAIAYPFGGNFYMKSFDGVEWETKALPAFNKNPFGNCNTSSDLYTWLGGSKEVLRMNNKTEYWESFSVPSFGLHSIAYSKTQGILAAIDRTFNTNQIRVSYNNGVTWSTKSCGNNYISAIRWSERHQLWYLTKKDPGFSRLLITTDFIDYFEPQTFPNDTFDGLFLDPVESDGKITLISSKSSTNDIWVGRSNNGTQWQWEYYDYSELNIGVVCASPLNRIVGASIQFDKNSLFGYNWQNLSVNTSINELNPQMVYTGMIWFDNKYIAINDQNLNPSFNDYRIHYSPDGINWTDVYTPGNLKLSNIFHIY